MDKVNGYGMYHDYGGKGLKSGFCQRTDRKNSSE